VTWSNAKKKLAVGGKRLQDFYFILFAFLMGETGNKSIGYHIEQRKATGSFLFETKLFPIQFRFYLLFN